MKNFQLYKNRNFNDYISDTLHYVKTYWKNFYGNYLLINGVAFVALLILPLFVGDISSQLRNIITNGFDGVFSGFVLIIGTLLWLLLIILLSIMSSTYPIAHMSLIEKGEKDKFSVAEIFSVMRPMFRKAFVFMLVTILLSMLLIIPISIIAVIAIVPFASASLGAGSYVVIAFFSILLVPIVLILVGSLTVILNQGLITYLNEAKGIMYSLKRGFKTLRSHFWQTVGATLLAYLLIQVLALVLVLVPNMIITMSAFFSDQPSADTLLKVSPVLSAMNSVFKFCISTILILMQCLIYYSSKERVSHVSAFKDIESIGE